MHNGTTDFLKYFLTAILAVLFIWWLQTYFGAIYALMAIILTAGTLFFVAGALLTHFTTKNTIENITQYAAKDAMVDKYRMQTSKDFLRVQSHYAKADGQLKVLEAKQEQKLLTASKPNEEDDTFWATTETVDLEGWN